MPLSTVFKTDVRFIGAGVGGDRRYLTLIKIMGPRHAPELPSRRAEAGAQIDRTGVADIPGKWGHRFHLRGPWLRSDRCGGSCAARRSSTTRPS